MTTHSMEEADILGDRMGIIVRGTLRCLGTSLRLKSRFGSGYRVSIHISEVDDQKCTQEVKRKIQDLFQLHLGVEIGEIYHILLRS
jgi:ABC-type multidrug transport system ATPase subunit